MHDSDNLKKLKALIDRLENEEFPSEAYKHTLNKIKTVILEEEKIIGSLNKEQDKIVHYQNICNKIISMINTNSPKLSVI